MSLETPTKTGIQVLAVDDEDLNLDLIEFAFSDDDVAVARAGNGREALDLLEELDPEVILLDLNMPVMNGYETLARLKAHDRFRDLPVIVVTANSEENTRALAAGADDFLAKPVNVEELKLRTRNHAKIKKYNDLLKNQNSILEDLVRLKTRHLEAALGLARDAGREIAFRLGRAAEFRDRDTGAHIWRMSRYCALLARLYGMQEDEVDLVLNASPLHDIGKVGIPDHILLKPGSLTPQELQIMREHSVIGAKMLEGCEQYPLLRCGRIIALEHHEKFDGSGYPQGLAGQDIHIYGRVAAVADVFDALSSPRVYKDPFSHDQVMALMAEGRGKHFDPDLVDLLFRHMEDFLAIQEREPDAETESTDTLECLRS